MHACTSAGDLVLAVRIEDHKGVLDAPVGSIGDMRHATHAVEGDIVAAGDAATACAESRGAGARFRQNAGLEGGLRRHSTAPAVCRPVRCLDGAFRFRSGDGAKPGSRDRADPDWPAGRLPDTGCASPPRCRPAPRTTCAPNDRSCARRAVPRPAPAIGAEQADDDLTVGKRGVVIGNFANALG
jgi:hypothetical protein